MDVTTIESCRTSQRELRNVDMDTIRKLSTFMFTVLDTDQNTLTVQLENNQVPQSSLGKCLRHGFQMLRRKRSDVLPLLSVLKLLLQFGAKLERFALFGGQKTPYHIICQCPDDQIEILELMIEADNGKLVDAKDSSGCTPLIYAVRKANIKCVKSLTKNGADINHLKIRFGYSSNRQQELTPLIEAIVRYPTHKDIFNFLLEIGVDVNKADSGKRTPLMHAAAKGSIECVENLLQKGAQLDMTDGDNRYVWEYAAQAENEEILKSLIDHGVDKNAIDSNGKSVLYCAVENGNAAAVRYLLNLGVTLSTANPSQCNKLTATQNYDPFMLAIRCGMVDVVQALDGYTQMFKDLSALRSAAVRGHTLVVRYLLSKYKYPLNKKYQKLCIGRSIGRNVYTTVLDEVTSFQDDVANSWIVATMLLDHGADPNKKNSRGLHWSLLHKAITIKSSHSKNLITNLIRNGADINLRSFEHVSKPLLPFEASLKYNNIYATEALLISGCSCGPYSYAMDYMKRSMMVRLLKKGFINLMEEWNVEKNSVKSLKQVCRTVILKQLSPAANKKISMLPLPVNYPDGS